MLRLITPVSGLRWAVMKDDFQTLNQHGPVVCNVLHHWGESESLLKEAEHLRLLGHLSKTIFSKLANPKHVIPHVPRSCVGNKKVD